MYHETNFHHPARGSAISEAQRAETEQSITNDEFLSQLYDAALDWFVKNKGGQVITELEAQQVNHWESYEPMPGRIVRLGLDLQRGVLARSNGFDLALVLGVRKRTTYDSKPTLGLEFGLIDHPLIRTEDRTTDTTHPDIDVARMLVNQRFLTHGSGEFYIHDYSSDIVVDCWADHRTFGGKMVRDWPQRQLLSPIGIRACVETIEKTAERAFW